MSAIYREGREIGIAASITEPPDWNDGHFNDSCLLDYEFDGIINNWCAIAPVLDTLRVAGVAEVSVYVPKNHHRLGIGKAFLARLTKEYIWSHGAQVHAGKDPLRRIPPRSVCDVSIRVLIEDGGIRECQILPRKS